MSSKVEPPFLLIVAGPNGSGKSSAYQDADIEEIGRSVWIINPDLLTVRIQQVEGLDLPSANLAAVQRIEAWLEASIAAHQTIGVETVLSTPKYRRLVEQAKQLKFQVRLVYVILDSPERSIARIALRVRKGGHNVADEDVRKRYARSLEQMPWFLDQADQAWLFDNSGAQPKLIGTKEAGVLTLARDALPALVDAIQKDLGIGTGAV